MRLRIKPGSADPRRGSPRAGAPLLAALLALVTWNGVAAAGPLATTQPVTEDARRRIDAVNDPAALIALAQEYLVRQDEPAAAACVERACRLKPEWLESTEPQSPARWNEAWFRLRAAVRVGRLAAHDAAGRTEVAAWLFDAGLAEAAADLLLDALDIDRRCARARELADEWGLFGGGPMEFDLRPALSIDLTPEVLADEGLEAAPREGRTLLLVPFDYVPTRSTQVINRTALRVRDEAGRTHSPRGLVLLNYAPAAPACGEGARTLPAWTLQADNEPIWERIEVEPVTDASAPLAGPFQLICVNSSPPMVRGGRARRPAGPSGSQPRQGSGYAAFVVEVPAPITWIEVSIPRGPTLRIENALLELLHARIAPDTPAARLAALTEALRPAVRSFNRPIAGAAVAQLAMLAACREDLAVHRALLETVMHPDSTVRARGFEAVLNTRSPPSAVMVEAIESCPDPAVLESLLDELAIYLAAPAPSDAAPQAAAPQADSIRRAVAMLPSAADRADACVLLGACTRSGFAQVRDRAVGAALAAGTQESISLLVHLTRDTQASLIRRLPELTDLRVRSAAARVLLAANPQSAASLGAVMKDLSLGISGEDDPLLAVLASGQLGAGLVPMLDILANADLSAVAESPRLRQALETLPIGRSSDAGVAEAALKLALAQFKPAYRAPARTEGDGRPTGPPTNAFENLLAMLASNANVPPEIAHPAAARLLEAGRVGTLHEALLKTTSRTRRSELIAFFVKDARWQKHEALPTFLAASLADSDMKNVQTALAALAALQKQADPRQMWRFRLAIKHGLPPTDRLIALTGAEDDKVAGAASGLLGWLAGLSRAEQAEMAAAGEPQGRADALRNIEMRRAGAPSGAFVCLLYVDVRSSAADQAGTSSTAAPARESIPLVAGTVSFQRTGDRIQVVFDGLEIGAMPAPDPAGAGGSGGSVQLGAATLLRAALLSEDARREGLTGKIDLLGLAADQRCDVRYERLGTWAGTLSLTAGSGSAGPSSFPLQIAGARLLLEPQTP